MMPSANTLPGNRRRRAVLLMITLWIGLILAMMAFSLAYEMQVNLKLTGQTERRMQARALARAGLAKAAVDLRNDRVLAIADPVGSRGDTYLDPWAKSEDKTDQDLGKGSYTVRVVDEHSKINLNLIHQQNYHPLSAIIQKIGDIKAEKADKIALMIVDWQDPDPYTADNTGNDEGDQWTKYAFAEYGDTLPDDWSFRPRNDPMLTLEELYEIPGITREMMVGPAEDDDDPHARLRRRREESGRNDFDERKLALPEYLSVQSAKSINLNTAPKLVIEALLSNGETGSGAETVADQFIEFRNKTMETKGGRDLLLNPQALAAGGGISDADFGRMKQSYPIGVDSTLFTLTSTGTCKGASVTLEAKVEVGPDAFQSEGRGKKDDEGERDPEARAEIREREQFVIDPAVRVREMREY